jgi:hypothetical protein
MFLKVTASSLRITANLSLPARQYLKQFGIDNPDADMERASLLWMHALAIGYSPAYLKENEDGIRQDWPRIPLPASREVLEGSARLGHAVAALLDIDGPVKGVTSGTVRPEQRVITGSTIYLAVRAPHTGLNLCENSG